MQHPGFVIEPFLYIPTGKKILSKDENDVRNHELPLLLLQRLMHGLVVTIRTTQSDHILHVVHTYTV